MLSPLSGSAYLWRYLDWNATDSSLTLHQRYPSQSAPVHLPVGVAFDDEQLVQLIPYPHYLVRCADQHLVRLSCESNPLVAQAPSPGLYRSFLTKCW